MTQNIFAPNIANRVWSFVAALALTLALTLPTSAHAGPGAEMYNEFLEKGII